MRGFRAWHTKLGRYLKDNEFYINSKGSVCSAFETYDDEVRKADCVEDFSRDDFDEGYIIREDGTGLEDKNGKEIYVGDIVECGPYSGKPIISEEGRYWLGEELEDLFYADLHYYIEVIGNIHENPELLEERE